jgi:hypothetical protein
LINAGTLSGAATITANGGYGVAGTGGGGGGGRIALLVATNTFIGTVTAFGGGGAQGGGAGTVYSQNGNPELVLDNGGMRGTNTFIESVPDGTVSIRNGAVGVATELSANNVFIGSNAWLTANLALSNTGLLSLVVSSNVLIRAGGGIVVDGMGYGGGQGPGAGHPPYAGVNPPLPASGGGHGGFGGVADTRFYGGFAYDFAVQPIYPGSGGGQSLPNVIGGAGGGYVSVVAGHSLQVDGLISANGSNGSGGGGGGAGGTALVLATSLFGSGAIQANGGGGTPATAAGGGGGGCVSVAFDSNAFSGSITAYGGGPTNWGGAGTVLVKTNSEAIGQLRLDNGGRLGANSKSYTGSLQVDLVVSGGASMSMESWNVRNLSPTRLNNCAPGNAEGCVLHGQARRDPRNHQTIRPRRTA